MIHRAVLLTIVDDRLFGAEGMSSENDRNGTKTPENRETNTEDKTDHEEDKKTKTGNRDKEEKCTCICRRGS